jgi:hypothetical protein
MKRTGIERRVPGWYLKKETDRGCSVSKRRGSEGETRKPLLTRTELVTANNCFELLCSINNNFEESVHERLIAVSFQDLQVSFIHSDRNFLPIRRAVWPIRSVDDAWNLVFCNEARKISGRRWWRMETYSIATLVSVWIPERVSCLPL